MVIHRDQRRADTRVVLDEFEGWLLRERSTQDRTAAAYTARVAGFVEWLPAPVEDTLRALTAATVIEWVNLEAARGLKASTLGKQMVMLRSFLQFCRRTGRTGQDFAGVGLGLRACEIAGLRLGDIGWLTGSLRIHGKGDRVDELPLPDEVGKALEEYVLNGRGGLVEGDEVFWTVIAPVQPLTANGVCGAVRQLCTNAGVTKFGPHRLRQTFATGALASGATLQEVQGLLRHAHLRTTAIYAKVDTNRLTQLVPEWPAAASGRWGR